MPSLFLRVGGFGLATYYKSTDKPSGFPRNAVRRQEKKSGCMMVVEERTFIIQKNEECRLQMSIQSTSV